MTVRPACPVYKGISRRFLSLSRRTGKAAKKAGRELRKGRNV